MNAASIYQRLRSDLRSAMSDRDRAKVAVLRTAISAVDNAGAVEVETTPYDFGFSEDVPRRHVDDLAIRQLLAFEVDERRKAIDVYSDLGKGADVERLKAEIAVLRIYL